MHPRRPGRPRPPAHDAGQFSQPLVLAVRPAIFDRNVPALDVARPSQRLTEGGHYGCASVAREGVQPADHRDGTLLCPRADRQTSCPTQERPGDRYTTMNIELPPPHSTPLQQRRCRDTTSNQRMLHRFAASQRTPIGDFRLGSKLTVHPSSAAKVKRTKSVNSVYPVYAARKGAGQCATNRPR